MDSSASSGNTDPSRGPDMATRRAPMSSWVLVNGIIPCCPLRDRAYCAFEKRVRKTRKRFWPFASYDNVTVSFPLGCGRWLPVRLRRSEGVNVGTFEEGTLRTSRSYSSGPISTETGWGLPDGPGICGEPSAAVRALAKKWQCDDD